MKNTHRTSDRNVALTVVDRTNGRGPRKIEGEAREVGFRPTQRSPPIPGLASPSMSTCRGQIQGLWVVASKLIDSNRPATSPTHGLQPATLR